MNTKDNLLDFLSFHDYVEEELKSLKGLLGTKGIPFTYLTFVDELFLNIYHHYFNINYKISNTLKESSKERRIDIIKGLPDNKLNGLETLKGFIYFNKIHKRSIEEIRRVLGVDGWAFRMIEGIYVTFYELLNIYTRQEDEVLYSYKLIDYSLLLAESEELVVAFYNAFCEKEKDSVKI